MVQGLREVAEEHVDHLRAMHRGSIYDKCLLALGQTGRSGKDRLGIMMRTKSYPSCSQSDLR